MSETEEKTVEEEPLSEGRGLLALWGGILIAPAAYFFQLFVAYGMVNWVCRNGYSFLITLVTIIALSLSAFGAYLAWGCWKRVGTEYADDKGDAVNRSRFMAVSGLILSALFFVSILAQEIPNWIVGACVGR